MTESIGIPGSINDPSWPYQVACDKSAPNSRPTRLRHGDRPDAGLPTLCFLRQQ